MAKKKADLKKWEAQLRKGSLEMILLDVVACKENYGFAIIREMQRRGMKIAEGTLYPIMAKLKKEGLVTTTWVYANTGHPRKFYKITKKGIDSLAGMKPFFVGFTKRILAAARIRRRV